MLFMEFSSDAGDILGYIFTRHVQNKEWPSSRKNLRKYFVCTLQKEPVLSKVNIQTKDIFSYQADHGFIKEFQIE